jgi:hypothetical protein
MKCVLMVLAAFFGSLAIHCLSTEETDPVHGLLVALLAVSGVTIISQILLLVYIYAVVHKTNNPLLLSAVVDLVIALGLLGVLIPLSYATFGEDGKAMSEELSELLGGYLIAGWVVYGLWLCGYTCCNGMWAASFGQLRTEDVLAKMRRDMDYEPDAAAPVQDNPPANSA